MASIGDLFIELGVVGDVKPLEKALDTLKESVKVIDKQIQGNQRLLKYRQDLAAATSENEKKLIKKTFADEVRKEKLLDETDATQKNIDAKKALAAQLGKVAKGFMAFAASAGVAYAAVNKLTNDLVKANQAMLNLTRTTDISLKKFQKWGSLGKMLGVENADRQLADLNKRLFEMRLTGQGARDFQLAGVNPWGQDAEGVLEQMRSRVQGMDDTSASYLLEQMGLDPQMLHLLRMTRSEFQQLADTMSRYQLTAGMRAEIQAMNVQLEIARQKMQYFKDRAILALMPAFTKFTASLARVTEGLAEFTKWVSKGETLGAKITKVILGIAAAIGVVTAAIWALTAHPIIAAITAIVGVLYLLIDDIAAYFNGGGSMLGVLLNFFDDFNKDLENKNFGGVFDKLAASLKALSFINASPALLAISAAAQSAGFLTEQINKWKNARADEAKIASNPYNFVTPTMQKNTEDNRVSYMYDQRQVNMTNTIQTSQPVMSLQNELEFARFAMV